MDISELIGADIDPVILKASQHVFRQGDTDRKIYFVREGILKAYYVSTEGKETIKSFILAGDFIGSLTAAYRNEVCSFSLVCQEQSVLLPVDFDILYNASQQDLKVASKVLDFVLGFAMKKERREMELLSMSAEDRYRQLQEQSPALLERVKQKEIARYLGITPVALSRIRKRIENQRDKERKT